MKKKKDLPLTILKALEGFVSLKGEKFEVLNPENHLLRIVDIDDESNFHFTIEKYQRQGSGFQLIMSRSPRNEHSNEIYRTTIKIEQLQPQFELWLKYLNEFEKVNSFFDDPIIKTFKEEYYTAFEILDEEDADIKPLNVNQILLLDSHLEYIEEKIDEYQNEVNKEQLIEIKENVIELRSQLTLKSKKWVLNKLAIIWAKMTKQGTKFIKDFIEETKKEGIKQGARALIELLKDNVQELIN